MKNRRYHRGIKRSPFEAMFGEKMVLANEDGTCPNYEDQGMIDEGNNDDDNGDKDEPVFEDWSNAIKASADGDLSYYPTTDDEEANNNKTELTNQNDETAILEERNVNIQKERVGAHKDSKSKLTRCWRVRTKGLIAILNQPRYRFALVKVGQTVRLPIDPVDRPKIGFPNLIGVVMEADNGFYKIGTNAGVLPQRFTRNQLEPTAIDFLAIEDVPAAEISFRAAVGANSMTGTQSHKHCSCTGGCTTKRCTCKKANMKCNSRCHQNKTCENK